MAGSTAIGESWLLAVQSRPYPGSLYGRRGHRLWRQPLRGLL